MSSQLINVGPPRGERNFGLAFNAIDENNYDFIYLSYDNAALCTKLTYGYVEKESLTKASTKSACINIQLNKWNFLKITVKDDCDHCDNVDGYVDGQRVFSFEAHFATRGFGGALAENGFSNVVEFREFDIGPIIRSLPDKNSCHGMEGTYIGCYLDDSHRDLKDGPKKYGYNQQSCNTACKAYTYYALQNNGWCVCGNGYSTKPQYVKKPDSECGGTRGLGGPFRNSIYKTCTI